MDERNDIKAINGIGPGSASVRQRVEERMLRKLAESQKRRADNPALEAYARPIIRRCAE